MAEERERVACVEIPALPLQLLLLDRPQWRELPTAVVEADRPQAKLSWVNEPARRSRILPGMRFAAARSLAGDLRASVVADARIESAREQLFELLLNFSPRVEPEAGPDGRAGTWWVDPNGMLLLWGELDAWALAVQQALGERGFTATVVVGFQRFRCQAIARGRSRIHDRHGGGTWVLPDRRREARMAAAVPLDRLGISARLRDDLASLGVRTLGEFMALPRAELRARFGREAERLHKRGSDDHWRPMQARELVDPVATRVELEPPEQDITRLLRRIHPSLEQLLARLADRGCAMSGLDLRLGLDHADDHRERLEPAAPTLDSRQIVELLRLRLEAVTLPAAVEDFALALEGQRTDPRQIALFRARARRDLEAAERALARLRAAFGDQAVTQASLRAAHLPEARVSWSAATRVRFPEARHMQVEGGLPPRIRRLLPRPKALPPRSRHEPDGWIIDPKLGPVERLHGPYRASGGWWVREVQRDYYFAQTRSGTVLWVFYDRPRRSWYLHGWLD